MLSAKGLFQNNLLVATAFLRKILLSHHMDQLVYFETDPKDDPAEIAILIGIALIFIVLRYLPPPPPRMQLARNHFVTDDLWEGVTEQR